MISSVKSVGLTKYLGPVNPGDVWRRNGEQVDGAGERDCTSSFHVNGRFAKYPRLGRWKLKNENDLN